MKGKNMLAYIDTLTTPEAIFAYTANLSKQELDDLLQTTLRRADEEIKSVPQDARKGEAKKRINIKD